MWYFIIFYNQLSVKNSLYTRVINETHAWLKIMIALVIFYAFFSLLFICLTKTLYNRIEFR